MNTLIVAEQLRRRVPGGIGTYIRGLLQGLQHDEDQYLGLWASKRVTASEPLKAFGLPVYTSRLPSKLLTRSWDRGIARMPKGWDLVHATSTLVPPKTSTPMTAVVHDLGWHDFPDAYPKRGLRWHEASLQRTIHRARRIIVPSRATARALIDTGVDSKSVTVIPLGCDHLPAPDALSALRKLNRVGVYGDFVLAVGTLEPRKNLRRLVKAYERVREELPEDMSLVIVGPEGWGDQLRQSEGVFIISSATMPEITALYDRCTAFVSVPLLEGFGLPVLEAMSRGVPVVSSAVPSAGEATYLVDPLNTAAIGEGILRVVTEGELRKRLVRKGEEHCAGMTWQKCAKAHVDVWQTLV